MEYAITWYQRKVGAYDLQIWEKAVEIQEQKSKGMSQRYKHESSVKPELIDLDLVKGSTFSKSKPKQNMGTIMWMSLIRIIFFPLYCHWWIRQTNINIFVFIVISYFLECFLLFSYAQGPINDKLIPISEVGFPCIIMLALGLMHCQIISTNFSSYDKSNRESNLIKRRTLSTALLEPAGSPSYEKTLSFVYSRVLDNENTTTCKKESNEDVEKVKDIQDIDKELTFKKSAETKQNKNTKPSHPVLNNSQHEIDKTASSKTCNDDLEKKTGHVSDTKGGSQILNWHDDDDFPTEDYSSDSSCDLHSDNASSDHVDVSHVNSNAKLNLSATVLLPGSNPTTNHINVRVWENKRWQKCQVSILDIGTLIMKKVRNSPSSSDDFLFLAFIHMLLVVLLPFLYRLTLFEWNEESDFKVLCRQLFVHMVGGGDFMAALIVAAVTIQRLTLSGLFFVLMCAAQRTFQKRFLYAKYFAHLTSSRQAVKSSLPHFRLNKVQNIKLWLSLRSYLRRRGPQRSVDVIVSTAFLSSICLLSFITVQLMMESEIWITSLVYWDCLVWLFMLAFFLLQFITIGAKVNLKYSNISTLLTEQINLYLQMEQKPHKKEQFQRANCVLALAAKLIREIETPYNIYGLAMNPILYNIMRVIILSAFSGVLSEMLGFKLKIWKIKG